ncbi:MAG: NAD-dependent succinate-semialdehyde dehydrogenase [Saprospiraceae bacterium]|nr:NAD-dependent succinate-semialdehyde dehydrogenase [Saprospiraceae bacterium]
MLFQTINPVNNQLVESFSTLSDDDVQKKLNLSKKSFYDFWKDITTEERAIYILKIAQNLRQNQAFYASLITLEMGKPIKQSIAEIEKCAWLCEYFAEYAAKFLQDKIIKTEYQKSYVRYEPLGAILGIMPWNFPFWQVFRFGIPAALAGNVLLLKPAPNVPQCSLAIEHLFDEAIGQKGIFQTLFAEIKQIEHIIQHPIIKGIALTGSDRAGASVAAQAGAAIKKCVLELGGSDAFIVLDDANLEKAAQIGVQSRMNNAGQTCIAAKRFIVLEKVATQFTELLKENITKLKIGDPALTETDIGPMARPDLLDKLEVQVNQSIAKGATILFDGGRMNYNYFKPMILGNVQPGMPAYQEELFGPVISLFIAKDDEEAIFITNDSQYGLGAAIWSANTARAENIAKQLEAGAIVINDFVKSDPRLPFGGVKRSGFGRELAEEGIKEFVNIKMIVIH